MIECPKCKSTCIVIPISGMIGVDPKTKDIFIENVKVDNLEGMIVICRDCEKTFMVEKTKENIDSILDMEELIFDKLDLPFDGVAVKKSERRKSNENKLIGRIRTILHSRKRK